MCDCKIDETHITVGRCNLVVNQFNTIVFFCEIYINYIPF